MNTTYRLVQVTDLVLESNHTPVPGDILGAAELLRDITESLDNVQDIPLDKALDFMQVGTGMLQAGNWRITGIQRLLSE